MASKFWLCICLVLFAHNLKRLMNDSYLLSYKIVEEDDVFFDNTDLNYLVCTSFWRIQQLDSLLYKPKTQMVSVKNLLNHSIASIEHRLNVSGLFRLNESYIFNGHFCFSTTKSALEDEGKPFNEFLSKYETQSIFIYSKEKQPIFYERAYEKEDNLSSIYIKSFKQKVFGENHLLNADCLNRADQIHHDRFSCLNSCFVKKKMKNGFYRFDDEGAFDLSEFFEEKQIVTKEAKNCLMECPERSCFWEVVITLKIDEDYYQDLPQDKKRKKVDLKLNTYIAFYSMNDFYLQLFSLIALFTGNSVLRLLHAIHSLAAKKIQRIKKSKKLKSLKKYCKNKKILKVFRLVCPNFKHVLTLLSLVIVLVRGLIMINEFRFHSSHPNRTSTLNFSSEPFSVVVCFPIENFIDGEIIKGRNSEILRNFSFNSIEELSKNISHFGIISIKIMAGVERIRPKLHYYPDEILFKSSKFKGQQHCLMRCFRINFSYKNDKHAFNMGHNLIFLQIGFATSYKELFLIEKEQNFTTELANFRGLYFVQKVTKKYSVKSEKSNCRDYSEEPNCNSKRNCLDRCLSTKFFAKHGSIPTNTVVSKSHLNSSMLNNGVYFNETEDLAIKEECFALFVQRDCKDIFFEESPDRVTSEIDRLITIRLSYMNNEEKEMEYERIELFLSIVSLETIFFGSNALGMLSVVLLFFGKIFKFKWYRAYNLFIFLLASAGFLYQNFQIFQGIIDSDLNENEFFSKPEQYTLPSPILCFYRTDEIRLDFIDENYLFTGEYLDYLTKDYMTLKQIFSKITFVTIVNNQTHEKSLDLDNLNFTSSFDFYTSSELELTHIYYLFLKCFKINLKVGYREEDFFSLRDKTVLKIYFNRTIVNQFWYVILVHQQDDFSEIGGGFEFLIGQDEKFRFSYSIEFEMFKIVQKDKFELLKDPRRLFHKKVEVNDAKTAETMRKQFKDMYSLTISKPLDRDFDLEVDNELFKQHAKSFLDQATFKSQNFEKKIANTYTNIHRSSTNSNHPDFSFSFSFLVREVEITNNENPSKLVVDVLNTFSLWLNVCILDMGAWLYRMFSFALHLYRLLIKIRNRLDSLRVSN